MTTKTSHPRCTRDGHARRWFGTRSVALALILGLIGAALSMSVAQPDAQAAGGKWVRGAGVLLGGPPSLPEFTPAPDFGVLGGRLDWVRSPQILTQTIDYEEPPLVVLHDQTFAVSTTITPISGDVDGLSINIESVAHVAPGAFDLHPIAVVTWSCGPGPGCTVPPPSSATVTVNFGMGTPQNNSRVFSWRIHNCGDACKVEWTYEWQADAFCDGQLVTVDMNFGASGIGTEGPDVILGTPGADSISGAGGDDLICGDGGGDVIRAGAGNDTVFGGDGDDDILGGGGADIIDGGLGNDTLRGQGGTDTISGGDGNDTIDGQGAADVLLGGPDDDVISGQNGGDTARGGGGVDDIKGQSGPDTLRGDSGDDTLTGGNGNDILYGGTGFDRCSGNTGPNDQAQASTCELTPGVETLF